MMCCCVIVSYNWRLIIKWWRVKQRSFFLPFLPLFSLSLSRLFFESSLAVTASCDAFLSIKVKKHHSISIEGMQRVSSRKAYNYVCIVRVWRVGVCAYKKIEGGLNYLPFAHTHTHRKREKERHIHLRIFFLTQFFYFFIYLLLSCCLFLFLAFYIQIPYL